MAKRYKKLRDGQWSTLINHRPGYGYVHKIKCCDCGLVHVVQHEITARGMRFRAWRDKK